MKCYRIGQATETENRLQIAASNLRGDEMAKGYGIILWSDENFLKLIVLIVVELWIN